jgi:predicted nuclease of predicted toxin-antitoxin system
VKLLLDEHYSPQIAEQLRQRGHDVQSVKEREELRGLTDRALWERAVAEGRALVTENVADFMPLVREAFAAGEPFTGLVFTSPRSLPRSQRTIGVYVDALDRLLRNPRDGEVHWLKPPSA